MSGGHSEAWVVSCEKPANGKKRCRECGGLKAHPAAFVSPSSGAIVLRCAVCSGRRRELYQRDRALRVAYQRAYRAAHHAGARSDSRGEHMTREEST